MKIFFMTYITQFDVMLCTTSFRTVVYRFLSIRLLIFGLIVEKNDQLPINIMSILLIQWASKFTRDRKNSQNNVLFNDSLPRLRGNELSAKTRILTIFKTRFTESTSQISHYFDNISHVPQWSWSISQIVVRCQHYTC